MPLFITTALVINKHTRHSTDSTSPEHVMNISESQLKASVTMSIKLDNAFNVI